MTYLGKSEIARRAREVLSKYWDGKFPVDVEMICDKLGVGILPVPNLAEIFHVDAYIAVDFKVIYVDEDEFKKESYRYRFSVAHELGHLILHRKYYPNDVGDLRRWINISYRVVNDFAEYQANYFAGSLLAPEDELMWMINKEFGGSFVRNYWNASPSEIWNNFEKIRKYLMVSEQVIARRMYDMFPGVGEDIY